MKAKSKLEYIAELESKIDATRAFVDDVELMKGFSNERRHQICDYILNLQSRYKEMTGHYYIPEPKYL